MLGLRNSLLGKAICS